MLRDKCAIVTGSTSGIGLGIAMALAREGCHVQLNGFGETEAIESLRSKISNEHRVRVSHHRADLAHPQQIEAMMQDTRREFGRIDILVNNAGIQHVSAIESMNPEKWDALLAVNLSASFHTIRHALPPMRENGWGRIINIASVHGLVGSVHKCAYVAAKHGLVGLTKVVALETAGSGVTCNAIAPGWTDTELIRPQFDTRARQLGVSFREGMQSVIAEKQPSKQLVSIDQIAQTVLYLCSDAATQITGVTLPVDGGWTAQ